MMLLIFACYNKYEKLPLEVSQLKRAVLNGLMGSWREIFYLKKTQVIRRARFRPAYSIPLFASKHI